MNFRKLLTYFAFGTAAVMPFAGAQNPTILQGNYITNVFGNSNFVLNPNAQTNTANVTVSNATVTRSTTTPLVATSEFNITTSTSTGYADWSLRAFDAGMKNNNCEARFTYRGFSVGSTTAQILQGANVVAQLTLTASTDPRIASINFPCGDLSAVTKFRLQQATASLTGTNEIGGIYVGLATNMANVAQAENVVIASRITSAQTIPDNTSTTIIYNNKSLDVYGEFDTSTGIFTAKRAGYYYASAQYRTAFVSWAAGGSNYAQITLSKNNSTSVSLSYLLADAALSKSFFPQTAGGVYLSVGDTLRVIANIVRGASTDINSAAGETVFNIYRFPSSSELVVTPERQNVFAAASWTGGATFNRNNTTEFTISDSVFATNRTAFGKAEFTTTANDVAIKVPQMPPGTYRIEFAARQLVVQQASAGALDASCTWYLKDGTNTASARSVLYGNQYTIDAVSSAVQIVKYTTLADRTFTASAQSGTTNATACSLTEPKIIITPLDQPSNSALYVQGPILGAQTGAAISAGSVGEVKQSTIGVTNITGSAYTNLQTVTLTNGVWLCSSIARIWRNGATVPTNFEFLTCIGDSTSGSCNIGYNSQTIGNSYQAGVSTTFSYVQVSSMPTVVRYDGTKFTFAEGTTSTSATGILAQKVYLDASAGTPQAQGRLECVRIN